jgi:hypothetical protein
MADLFNNTSNDYINPTLNPCPGAGDGGASGTFEFLPGQEVGVISGSDIVTSMGLGDISVPVDGWTNQSKILQSGEVIFIPGLTKGISYRYQSFPFDGSVLYTNTNHSFYLAVDMSINYYRNFRYYEDAIHAEANLTNGITIENALQIALDAKLINVTTTYDASGLTFIGTALGYSYDITALDVSLFQYNSLTRETLAEDASVAIPAFKYPNGAMLGYVLKATYPSTVEDYESYIEINHVPDSLVYYEVSTGGCYSRYEKLVDVGLNSGLLCVGNTTVMSAADYLTYVEENSLWEKVGVIRIWLTATDPDNSLIENLITGFYIYNPHTFPVQISYMIIL